MKRAERAAERLKSCNHLGVLPISAPFKVAEGDDFNQIE
jgi:hypothetical protein